jgi:hypothetical protein
MNSIFKSLMAAGIVALACAGGAVRAQMPPATVIEGSVETTTDAVIFPSSLFGRVEVRNCDGASGRPLTISYRLRDLVVSRIAVLEK